MVKARLSMNNLDKLKEIINSGDDEELLRWMERYAYWFDPGGYFTEDEWRKHCEEEYEETEDECKRS